MRTLPLLTALVLGLAGLTACGDKTPADSQGEGSTDAAPALDLNLGEGTSARVVASGLMNPIGLAFDGEGRLLVCDSGHGQVLRMEDGAMKPFITDFDTEYWKVDPETGTKRFKLGPLGVAVLEDGTVIVSDGGKKDGAETLLFFTEGGKASDGQPTNFVPPTSDDAADKGEGNLCGFALSPDGESLWVAGQGSDAGSWILRCDIEERDLQPWGSADAHGIKINSPMQTLVWDDATVLVLYSGAGGKDDGIIVAWDVATKKPRTTWRLAGLIDPMGFDRIPGTDDLIVVDNNWALTEVKKGNIARVTLPEGGGIAKIRLWGRRLHGPTSCLFGPDGTLYVTQLGKTFDTDQGSVIAIEGLNK